MDFPFNQKDFSQAFTIGYPNTMGVNS